MKLLVNKVRKWGREKNINNVYSQFGKIVEELGETISEVNHGGENTEALMDGLGDTLVTLIIFADILGFDIEDCLKVAWEAIKNREGKTVNGMFIKKQ